MSNIQLTTERNCSQTDAARAVLMLRSASRREALKLRLDVLYTMDSKRSRRTRVIQTVFCVFGLIAGMYTTSIWAVRGPTDSTGPLAEVNSVWGMVSGLLMMFGSIAGLVRLLLAVHGAQTEKMILESLLDPEGEDA